MGDRLIKQRKRVSDRAFRGARDQRQCLPFSLDVLFPGNALQMSYQPRSVNTAQIEPLAPRQHRDRDFADFSGGENKFGMWRRLLERLQQRIEGSAGEHVDFIENIDLVARRDGRIADRVIDLAYVIDTVMRGSVHLDNVKMAALHDRLAMDAKHRHFDRWRRDGPV